MSLPEKWCIKQNLSQEVCDWFTNKYMNTPFLNGDNIYLVNHEETINYRSIYSNKIPEGYKEITLEEFERFILNKQPKYSIKDLAEGKVALEFNKNTDSVDDLNKVLNEAFPEDNCISGGYYRFYSENTISGRWFPSKRITNLPTQPLKEFLTMKKIIGYKLIKPEYTEAVIKITGMCVKSDDRIKYVTNYLMNQVSLNGTFITALRNAGVLDLWFTAVYEEEFKVGDWVTVTEAKSGFNGELGKTYKIFGWQPNYTDRFYYMEDRTVTISMNNVKVRKATQEEIDSVTKVMLPNSKYEIVIKEKVGVAKIDVYDFDKQFWQAAKTIAEHTKADVIVGCGAKNSIGSSNQWKLDLVTIQKVLDKLC